MGVFLEEFENKFCVPLAGEIYLQKRTWAELVLNVDLIKQFSISNYFSKIIKMEGFIWNTFAMEWFLISFIPEYSFYNKKKIIAIFNWSCWINYVKLKNSADWVEKCSKEIGLLFCLG